MPQNSQERGVTDPVSHLPITIHDSTSQELEAIPPPSPSPQSQPGDEGDAQAQIEESHAAIEDSIRKSRGYWPDVDTIESKQKIATAVIAAIAGAVGMVPGFILSLLRDSTSISWMSGFLYLCSSLVLAISMGALVLFFPGLQSTLGLAVKPFDSEEPNKALKVLSDDKEGPRNGEVKPESTAWLNSFIDSIWPIVNPTLFVSIADMLEDTMQTTLPKMVHGVRVADLGQGSEPVRFLGIRWLEQGDVKIDKQGTAAEEGDFVNFEVALAYRARPKGHDLKSRSENAHLLMEFWTVADIRIPVWVELRGFLANARVRFQLTPNPPFLSALTLTLLGQPKVSMSCTPLAKSFVNVMDVPGLSQWLHSSIDSAIGEYVAPRSLQLDLKTLLMGRDKMDTDAIGLLVITVKHAKGFKDGDGGKFWLSRDGKRGDLYVTISWAKWGKAMWATRIIQNEATPTWEETTAVLVASSELNADERLRLQLWDSDRTTADDCLGTVEVALRDLMTDAQTKNRISSREDDLTSTGSAQWPGCLTWDVGYFAKIGLEQILSSRPDEVHKIKENVNKEAEDKLREAKDRNETGEVDQQKREDMKEKTDEILSSKPPSEEWPTGILSIGIQQIYGLEIENIKDSSVKDYQDDGGEDLPSAYCTVIINHQRVYKTRTKLKANNPFFNAVTERFIRDWRTTTVIISVRDSRTHEMDPLLGVVVLPLRDLFHKKTIVTDSFPLVGGIGYGRLQLSLTFRSVQAKLPRQLLGWDIGTLEIQPDIRGSPELPSDLSSCRLIAQTLYSKAKYASRSSGNWQQKKGRPSRLAIKKRYASCLLIQFRKHVFGPDPTAAFCTLWLKDIADDEEMTISLPVRRNTDGALARARVNASDEIGEHVGSLEVTLRLWPGLSGYHKKLSGEDTNMKDVMEVLDCAEESREVTMEAMDGEQPEEASSSESSSSAEEEGMEEEHGHEGIIGEMKDLKKRKGALHRKHRGLMQWGGVRKMKWIENEIKDKFGEAEGKIKGKLRHRERETGMDTEV